MRKPAFQGKVNATAGVMKLANMRDSKSRAARLVGSSPTSGIGKKRLSTSKPLRSYVIGLALGDGNLSNPNGRAVRLRITCDTRYTLLLETVKESLQKLLPDNKVSTINRKGCKDIYCYSNSLEGLLEWKAQGGSKHRQKVQIPEWVKRDPSCLKACLRGLFQTDGSIYVDRGYTMTNFVSEIPSLAQDVFQSIVALGYKASIQRLLLKNGKEKFTIRVASNIDAFLHDLQLWKA